MDTENILGDLTDPSAHTGPVDLSGTDRARAMQMLRHMVTIRVVEEFIADRVIDGSVVCPCHLAIGQEAVPVGVASTLRSSDRAFGTHRSHGHYLAQGGELGGLLAEVLGKVTGCSRGMGGSMHLQAAEHGFIGSVPIVGATVPLAVGAGLAAQRDGRGDVAVAYLGDGAMEEGVVHESLNFAANFDIPIIFVVENNLFSSHLHINERQPADSVARFAEAHRIPSHVIDGNDVVAVAAASLDLVERARAGGGPGFLEGVTYRWRGHVGASEDIDVGVKRSVDLVQWRLRDPVSRLVASLDAAGFMASGEEERLREEVRGHCERAWEDALLAPFPDDNALLGLVYAEGLSAWQ